MLPHVLHVSGDFPDPFEPFKTPVIRSLIDLTRDDFQHEVVSINRAKPDKAGIILDTLSSFGHPALEVQSERFEYGVALRYFAPGRGILHETMLDQVGDWLVDEIRSRACRPELLVAHKLSIEGIAVQHAAQEIGIPYALSIQGDTDTKIVAARPDLKRRFASVLADAAHVFPFTPWALDQLTHRLGRRPNGITMLPCPTDIDTPLPPQASVKQGRGDFISVFHLQNHRRKNLKNLAKAFASIQAPTAEHSLTVIGGGDDQDVAACSKLIAGIDGASLAGRMDREPLRERMQRATALVLPSLRESFGLVFIEALFAGLPIIYPRGTAIDGYFDEYGFALAVDARDPHSIAAAMETAARSEHRLKEELGRWQTSEHASGFQRPMIARDFADGLRACLASDQTASG